ncbi:MAG: RecX family transcriptional regulator [Flavobacteriales bacterium]|nr:RecX family transcriptional regulator [Flavobacteriales bacterium]
MSITPEILEKAKAYCAYQERCQQEVRDKLYTLGLHSQQVELVIAQLISDGFVNEERFARTFARGKFRMKAWGRIRIIRELKGRKISEYCIRKAMTEIDEDDYLHTMKTLIDKKKRILGGKDAIAPIMRQKIGAYVIGKGFEPALVWAELNRSR